VDDLRAFDEQSLTIPLLPSVTAWDLAKKLSSKGERLCSIGDLIQTYQGEINETTMARFLSTDPSVGPKVLRGGNVQRYEFQPEAKQGVDKFIDIQAYEREIGGEKIAHTQLPRIGYQRNAALDNWRRLIFSSLPSPSYCFDSISYYLITDRVKAYALLALLNSQLLEWRFRLTSTSNHVNAHEIANLPAIRFTFTTPAAERARLVAEGKGLTEKTVNELVTNKRMGEQEFVYSFAEFVDSSLGRWLDARLTADLEQSDVVHDLLAHLAEQMIEMNKEKQAEVKGFLAWLEREIGASIDDLTRKTHLRNYLGDYQKGEPHLTLEEVLDILRRNRRRLKVDPSARAFQERLAREYQASLDKLLPLKARLAATDRLIDLIVYRLYGLSEDEVAVVEGTPPPDTPTSDIENGNETDITPVHSSRTTSDSMEVKGFVEKNRHVLRVASLLGMSSEAARQFIAEVQKASSLAPPFKLIAEVVEEMIQDSHYLDPAEVAERIAPRWAAERASRKSRSHGGTKPTFVIHPDGTVTSTKYVTWDD